VAGSLDDYKKKRDFGSTPEPPPTPKGPRGDEPVFVVHRHAASRLHYDLRIEMEGVLRSWAVPKGFSYDPKEKRLAVRTEDHPLSYEDFHGIIPAGQYGAGSMTIWDRGHYETLHDDTPAAVRDGELKLRLFGRRLRGEWHMVRTSGRSGEEERGQQTWLLFKSKDRYAGPARDSALGIDLAGAPQRALPGRVRAMEASAPTDATRPFSDPDWLFEMLFAGKRAFAEVRPGVVRLRGLRKTPEEIERALGRLHATEALLDGVLVALDEAQRPSAERLAARLAGRTDDPLSYYAFDLLHYDGFDLRSLPLIDRKTALRAVLPDSTPLLYVDHVAGDGLRLCEAVAAAGLPGVVAKRAQAPYTSSASSGGSDRWRTIPVEAASTESSVAEALASSNETVASRVRTTNPAKVYWPREGYTKGDLIEWYARVADFLLPHLRDRPVHMNRFPDGIEGKSFYQRQAKEDLPDWVETVEIANENKGEVVRQMVCNDHDTLLWLANQGSIDLHPWLSRTAHLDQPDFAVLDLDAKESPFGDVVRIARVAGRLLHGIGLTACLKTSGKTGMHIFVPLIEGYTYDHARMFCEALGRAVCRELPDIATIERIPSARGGRVYVDFLQNRRSQTIVPPYSARPVPGGQVSMPVHWDELDADLTPARFTIRTGFERLEHHGDLFRPVLTEGQDLLPAIEKLDEALRNG
jgi:bifunctional non-homologous end joining protein LigD